MGDFGLGLTLASHAKLDPIFQNTMRIIQIKKLNIWKSLTIFKKNKNTVIDFFSIIELKCGYFDFESVLGSNCMRFGQRKLLCCVLITLHTTKIFVVFRSVLGLTSNRIFFRLLWKRGRKGFFIEQRDLFTPKL